MKKYIIPSLLVVYAAALIYMFVVYRPGVKVIYQQTFPQIVNQPTQAVPQPTQNTSRLSQFQGFDYINNLVIGNKLHFTPILAVSNTSLGKDIGDIWFDAINSALRFSDGNSASGVEFVFKDFGAADPLYASEVGSQITDTLGGGRLFLKTIPITSANLLAGDSVMLVPAISGVKIIPDAIAVFYDDGTTYTHAGTDSTLIYTYANSVKTKIAYVADTVVEGTFDRWASIAVSEESASTGQPYWIRLKNFNTGTGTIKIYFYYFKV